MKIKKSTSFLVLIFGLLFNAAFAQAPTVYLSNTGNYNVLEGTVYSFKVKLYSTSPTPVIVNVTTTPDTASAFDYTPLTTTITIPAGQLSSAALTIATTNDSNAESNEMFVINGTVTSGNTANPTALLNVYITDDDTAPTLTLNSYNSSLEGLPNVVSMNLTSPYNAPITISFTTTAGTAGAGDFTAISTIVTIPAGQTSASVSIPTTNDALPESNETFRLNGTITSGNTTNTSVTSELTIIDNDTIPTLYMEHDSITEGQLANFYPRLSNPFHSDIVIQLTASTGTAGTADFTVATINKTISAGNYTTTVASFSTTDDLLDEPNEIFYVTATSAGIANSPVVKTATIVDNDGLPDLIIYQSNEYVQEGEDATFYLYLTQPSALPTVIQVASATGTAGALDFTPLNATYTIPAGQQSISTLIAIHTLLDQLQEPTETFHINAVITSGNTYSTTASQTGTIEDNYNINAHQDTVESVAEIGTTFQLLTNDTLHGLPLNAVDATITLSSNDIGATIDAQGLLTIPPNAPIGTYQLNYTICEIANPAICASAFIMVYVKSPLSASYELVYSDYNTDGFTSVGDLITYQFTIANIGNAPITNIGINSSWGLTILGGPIASLGIGQTDNTTFYATHILTQNDINNGFFQEQIEASFKGTYYAYEVTDWADNTSIFHLTISDGIKLNAFVDSNSNGVQDAAESNFPLGHFNYEVNNDGIIHNLYTTPFYLYESNPTTTYNLTYTVDPAYVANNSCTVSYSNTTVATASGITTYNFPVTVTPYQEVSANLVSYLPGVRTDSFYNIYIKYTNNSNQTVASGTITFTKDSVLNMYDTSVGATLTATGFTYNYTNLLPYETRYMWVRMTVPGIPTVSLGQLVTFSVSITPSGDLLPLNNTDVLTQTIVGSYDPNEKTESHGGKILHSSFTANDYLTYTIHFENTGTANAINIKVEDILDSKLEPSSIKMVDASAAYSLERIGNHLTWKFSGIDLPPSIAGTETGKGYVTFQVKPKTGYVLGDVIPNTADIFFDFNPAIVTNTCTTEFVNTLATTDFAFDQFSYYPNPVKNSLRISNTSKIESVRVTSVLGQEVLVKKVNDLQTELDLSLLSKGIYFVKVKAQEQEKVVKITKE